MATGHGPLGKMISGETGELSAFLQNILDSSSEYSIIGIDLDGRILLWNRGAHSIYGYEPEDVVGKQSSSILYTPEDIAAGKPQQILQIALQQGKWEGTIDRVRKDGDRFVSQVVITPRLDLQGQAIGFLLISKDISEEVKLTEELQSTQFYVRSLIEASLDPLVTINPDGQITDVNQASIEITGQLRERLIGTDFSDYFTEPENARQAYRQVLQKGFLRDYPLTIRHICGKTTEVLYNASLYRGKGGEVLGVFAAARDVTELKKAEREVRTASAYNRRLIEASLDPLVTIGPDGKITDVNQATEAVTGVTREKLIGDDFSNYFTEPEKARHGYQQVLAEGSVRDYPLTIRHVCDKTTEVLYNASLYRNEAGEMQGVFAAARDVTELRKAEKKLQTAGAYNRSLIEASLDPLVTIGRDGKITDVNQATETVTGVTRQQLIGDDFSNYFTEPEKATQGYLQVLAEGWVRDYPLTIRHTSGKTTDVLYNATVYRNEEGEIQGVFAAARDITERKRTEKALQESEEKFRLVTETIEDVFWISTPGVSRMLYISPAYEKLWQRPRTELYASPRTFLEVIHPDDLSPFLSCVANYHAQGLAYECEYRIQPADGRTRWIRERGFPIRDETGKVQMMTGSCTDISERKQAEEVIQKLNAELEERVVQRTAQLEYANRELETFAYSVSHDLRAPLRAITGYTNILLEEYEPTLDAEGQRICGVISHEARRMGRLIDDLLSFSRLSRMEMCHSWIDMQEMVQSVFHELTQTEGHRRIDFQVEALAPAAGDPGMIRQVWVNLLSNALKFTSQRKRAVIHVGCRREGKEAVYFVQDNGAGFDMKYSDKLFGVFQRLHSEHEFEGTGVGLAIVQRVIHRHGGRVWGEGQVEQGAVFHFSLPGKEESDE